MSTASQSSPWLEVNPLDEPDNVAAQTYAASNIEQEDLFGPMGLMGDVVDEHQRLSTSCLDGSFAGGEGQGRRHARGETFAHHHPAADPAAARAGEEASKLL